MDASIDVANRDDSAEVDPRTQVPRDIGALLIFAALTAGVSAVGSLAVRPRLGVWYRLLRKPPFQPSPKVFAPVWSVLYGIIAYSGYRVWKQTPSSARTRALTLWGGQLGLNAAWSPLFFGARAPRAAFADLVLLLLAVGAYAEAARRIDRKAAAMMIPYLGWLGFAGALNEEIVRRN